MRSAKEGGGDTARGRKTGKSETVTYRIGTVSICCCHNAQRRARNNGIAEGEEPR